MEKYLNQLKEIEYKFSCYKRNLDEIIKTVSSEIHHIVISKGRLANPTPYYYERLGRKLMGKIVKHPIISDDCMKYYYDSDNRIIMVEEYSVSMKRFRITDIFLYNERTERLHFSSEILIRLFVFDHGFSNTELCFSFSERNGYCAEEYVYVDSILQEIKISRPETTQEIHRFVYEGQALIQIERVCQNGYHELMYTTKKPNFAKIKEEISQKLKKLIAEYEGTFVSFGIEGFLDQQQPMFCVCFTDDHHPEERIADWHAEMYHLQVYDWQLNDAQEKKCAKMIAEILVELTEVGLLKDKQIFFHQSQICAAQRYTGVKSVFRKSGIIIR